MLSALLDKGLSFDYEERMLREFRVLSMDVKEGARV